MSNYQLKKVNKFSINYRTQFGFSLFFIMKNDNLGLFYVQESVVLDMPQIKNDFTQQNGESKWTTDLKKEFILQLRKLDKYQTLTYYYVINNYGSQNPLQNYISKSVEYTIFIKDLLGKQSFCQNNWINRDLTKFTYVSSQTCQQILINYKTDLNKDKGIKQFERIFIFGCQCNLGYKDEEGSELQKVIPMERMPNTTDHWVALLTIPIQDLIDNKGKLTCAFVKGAKYHEIPDSLLIDGHFVNTNGQKQINGQVPVAFNLDLDYNNDPNNPQRFQLVIDDNTDKQTPIIINIRYKTQDLLQYKESEDQTIENVYVESNLFLKIQNNNRIQLEQLDDDFWATSLIFNKTHFENKNYTLEFSIIVDFMNINNQIYQRKILKNITYYLPDQELLAEDNENQTQIFNNNIYLELENNRPLSTEKKQGKIELIKYEKFIKQNYEKQNTNNQFFDSFFSNSSNNSNSSSISTNDSNSPQSKNKYYQSVNYHYNIHKYYQYGGGGGGGSYFQEEKKKLSSGSGSGSESGGSGLGSSISTCYSSNNNSGSQSSNSSGNTKRQNHNFKQQQKIAKQVIKKQITNKMIELNKKLDKIINSNNYSEKLADPYYKELIKDGKIIYTEKKDICLTQTDTKQLIKDLQKKVQEKFDNDKELKSLFDKYHNYQDYKNYNLNYYQQDNKKAFKFKFILLSKQWGQLIMQQNQEEDKIIEKEKEIYNLLDRFLMLKQFDYYELLFYADYIIQRGNIRLQKKLNEKDNVKMLDILLNNTIYNNLFQIDNSGKYQQQEKSLLEAFPQFNAFLNLITHTEDLKDYDFFQDDAINKKTIEKELILTHYLLLFSFSFSIQHHLNFKGEYKRFQVNCNLFGPFLRIEKNKTQITLELLQIYEQEFENIKIDNILAYKQQVEKINEIEDQIYNYVKEKTDNKDTQLLDLIQFTFDLDYLKNQQNQLKNKEKQLELIQENKKNDPFYDSEEDDILQSDDENQNNVVTCNIGFDEQENLYDEMEKFDQIPCDENKIVVARNLKEHSEQIIKKHNLVSQKDVKNQMQEQSTFI